MVENGKLASRVKAAREGMGKDMNKTRFAKIIGVSRAAVSIWEKTGEIKRTNLAKVAKATGHSIAEFADEESPLDDLARISPQNRHIEEETMEENMDPAARDIIKLFEKHGVHTVQRAYDLLMKGPALLRTKQVRENP